MLNNLSFWIAFITIAFCIFSGYSEGKMNQLKTAHAATFTGRVAVVTGATSGIGRACAIRLADAGFSVFALGRSQSRGHDLITALSKAHYNQDHKFISCDAFSLSDVRSCASKIAALSKQVDVLVLSQGMGSIQGFTPTVDGNDEKLTLHWWSRAAFIIQLLPQLKGGTSPTVISVLSGGVHRSFEKGMKADVGLVEKGSYSVPKAADAAGYYNDLGLDALARANEEITFIHAAPGFVRTNWGTEMPKPLRWLIRGLQVMGRKPEHCAEYMLSAIWKTKDELVEEYLGGVTDGRKLIVFGQDANVKGVTKTHTTANVNYLWASTLQILANSKNEIKNQI